MKALVIIPTYNEAGNVESLVRELMKLELKCRLDVMIRDDRSPDGTGEIVTALAQEFPGRIYLELGDKQGLGQAMRKAFDSARTNYDHDVIATMDCDWSHQPEDLAILINAVHDGKDVAIGSRYVKGGLIPGDWSAFFLLRTIIATRVARWVGGINDDIHELTTNMRAFSRDVLNQIDYNRINLSGYSFQIMLTNELTKHEGWEIVELPIAFKSRDTGNPKGQASDVIEFMMVAYRLNPDSPVKETARYLLAGISGAIVNVGMLYALTAALPNEPVILPLVIAIQTSIFWNFIVHSLFTFRSRTRRTSNLFSTQTAVDFAKYQLITMITQSLTVGLFLVLNNSGIYPVIALATGICTTFIFNYYFSRKYIWNNRLSRPRPNPIVRLATRATASKV